MNNRHNALAPVWKPGIDQLTRSHIAKFAARYCQLDASSYVELLQWSIDDSARFWSAVWEYCGAIGDIGYRPQVIKGERIQDTKWFPQARLNYAQNLLQNPDDSIALVFRSETLERRIITRKQLYTQVAKFSRYLQQTGVGKGDCIAGFMPNSIEAIVATLATASIGAVWCSCSSDFGLDGAYDRFSQVNPKVLIGVDGYIWKGKAISIKDKLARLSARLDTNGCPHQIIEVPFIQVERESPACPQAISWHTAMENAAKEIQFEQVGFDHPLFVMFSSGTTGVPKCIIHRTGGVLLQHLKEHQLHCDIRAGDVVFFYTTCGWMMWNWLITALASKATLVLFDGSALYPYPAILWEIAQQEGISFFGISAKYIQTLQKIGVDVSNNYDISKLRTIGSTGSPLAEENYDYVYQFISADVHLASMSGGTDIISCFVLGNPCLPVYRGEIQCAGLGLQVDVFDDNNLPCKDTKGELVCRNAFPSMPLGFGSDPDGSKYHKAYFANRPRVWAHSDFAEKRLHKTHTSYIIHGRFDSTLNPGGVRIGTAEIYRQVEKITEITESLAVGKNTSDNEMVIVLFVVMKTGIKYSDKVEKKLINEIRNNATMRHVPNKIIPIADIPRTRNGKIAELAVRDVIHGLEVKNIQALANPECLKLFTNLPQLQN